MSKITVDLAFDRLTVHFAGILHLTFARSKLLGVQSWVMNESKKFCIEYTFLDGATILTEYDDANKFRAILNRLDAVL